MKAAYRTLLSLYLEGLVITVVSELRLEFIVAIEHYLYYEINDVAKVAQP
jgi:hypothetical protein